MFQRELGHYYGYVYFRQVRDKSLKRGYFQKVSEKLKLGFSRTKHRIHLHQNVALDVLYIIALRVKGRGERVKMQVDSVAGTCVGLFSALCSGDSECFHRPQLRTKLQ